MSLANYVSWHAGHNNAGKVDDNIRSYLSHVENLLGDSVPGGEMDDEGMSYNVHVIMFSKKQSDTARVR